MSLLMWESCTKSNCSRNAWRTQIVLESAHRLHRAVGKRKVKGCSSRTVLVRIYTEIFHFAQNWRSTISTGAKKYSKWCNDYFYVITFECPHHRHPDISMKLNECSVRLVRKKHFNYKDCLLAKEWWKFCNEMTMPQLIMFYISLIQLWTT